MSMDKRLIIVGASGHGKVVADIAFKVGYKNIAFLDDDETVKDCMGYPVIGKVTDSAFFAESDFFVAIGNSKIRRKIQYDLSCKGINIVTLIHPDSVISDSVRIGTGTVIMPGVIVNPDTVISDGCIINTGATIDHDNIVSDFAHISVGAHLAGTVKIGENTWIGTGAVVSNNINICNDCIIGAGAVVIKDVTDSGTYIGVPAKKVDR